MLKFTATGPGTSLVGLGLTPENVERLQAGQPIRVRLSELGFVGAIATVQILIFAGPDTETMMRDLSEFVTPETVVHHK